MAKSETAETERALAEEVFANFSERWKEVEWNKFSAAQRAAIYRVMFFGGLQLEIVLEMQAKSGNMMMKMWVGGDFRAEALTRFNRFGKKFLREYPIVELTHQRIRLTEWGALTKTLIKDPYHGSEVMDLVMDTIAPGRVFIKKKGKETYPVKRKLKKRGRKTLAEAARLAKVKPKPKPIPAHAKDRKKLRIGIDEVFSAHTQEPLRRDIQPRADQLPFLPAMSTIRDVRAAYAPYLDLNSRRNRLHLAFDAAAADEPGKSTTDREGNRAWSSDIIHAAMLRDREKHSY